MKALRIGLALLSVCFFSTNLLFSQQKTEKKPEAQQQEGEERRTVKPAPDRTEGEGPFERLIIRGVTVIDGTGAPPIGPMDVVVEGNKIARVQGVGNPGLPINEERRPKLEQALPRANATKEIDAHGHYLLPGIVDLHVHTGGVPKAPEAEYVYKLWLAHGITTVRGVSAGPLEWSLSERARSAKNEITAPHIVSYHRFGQGKEWREQNGDRSTQTPEDARAWVQWAAKQGIDGLKMGSYRPDIMHALLDEAKKFKLGSTAHLGQMGVAQMNAIDAARLGLSSMTHYYGLFESMYEHNDVQPWPVDMNYANEQHRFGQVARQWNLVKPGGEKWNKLQEEFLALDFYINPTMTIYSAGRDVMRARNADWHTKYTLPSQMDFYQPSREAHGSYWFYWTTQDEVAWKNFYRVWMQFLNEYKNRGGKVTVGSDSGFIYQLYGFGTILELELLLEAGFHPLEVIRSATMYGAMEIHKPKGTPIDFGVIAPGMRADMLIVEENPLENLKVLYGTGAVKVDENNKPVRVGGVKYTIKDGIVFDAKQLLADVAKMVEKQKQERAAEKTEPTSGGVE